MASSRFGLVTRIERDAPPIRFFAQQRIAKAGVGPGVVGVDLQGLAVVLDGLGRILVGKQGNAKVVMGLGIVRLDFEGPVVVFEGSRNVLRGNKCVGKVIVGRHHVGVAVEGLAVVLDGARHILLVIKSIAKVAVDHGIVGLDFEGPVVVLGGGRLILVAAQNDAQVVVGIHAQGPDSQRCPVRTFLLHGVRRQFAEIIKHPKVARVIRPHLPQQLDPRDVCLQPHQRQQNLR